MGCGLLVAGGQLSCGGRTWLTFLLPSLAPPPPQVPVPRHSVGVVIGRSGEMIKKIQNDAGVRIQFKQGQGRAT